MKNRIAYLGPSGTFTQKAAREMNVDAKKPEWVERGKIQHVIDAVAKGDADRGVIPLRTDYADVPQTLDRLLKALSEAERGKGRRIYITGYAEMGIEFYLAAREGTRISEIGVIATKQQAAEACEDELEGILATYKYVDSTALGAQMASKNEGYATLCSREAMESNGLVSILERPISKTTRFIRVGSSPYKGKRQDETAIMVRLYEDRPRLLEDIEHEVGPVNQTDLYTLKNRQDSEGEIPYSFVIRLAANKKDAGLVVDCLRAMARKEVLYGVTRLPKIDVLGTYPVIALAGNGRQAQKHHL